MNKIHKTVWSQPLNQWVVSSELAKGKSKSSGSKKPMLLVTAAMALSASAPGWANCLISGTSTNGANCTDPNVTISGATISKTEGHAVNIHDSGSVNNVEINGINTIRLLDGNTASGTNAKQGVIIENTSGAIVNITGGITTINLDPGHGDTGFLLSGSAADTADGIVKIDAGATLNITNNGNWRTYENDGLEINGAGQVKLEHKGKGTIETHGGNAIFLRQNGTKYGVDLDLVNAAGKGKVVLETYGSSLSANAVAGNHGISAALTNDDNKDGVINIKTNAQIKTHGEKANGILALAKNGTQNKENININNQGAITTDKLGAAGIVAIGNTGDIRIENSGGITTQKDQSSASVSYADGIYAVNQNGASYIENNGVIIANGYDSAGIRAEQTAASQGGNIHIVTGASSNITTNGTQAEGIHANIGSERLVSSSASAGHVMVDAKGNITTNGNLYAEGIYAAITKGALNKSGGAGSYSTGDINVKFSGDTIRTTGQGTNRGIFVRQDGIGSVNVTHAGNLIKTHGNNSHGISVEKKNRDNNAVSHVEVSGKIKTDGYEAHAIHQVENGSGRLEVSNSNATLTTSGGSANGINIGIYNDGRSSQGIGVQMQGSTINTTGEDAAGIVAQTQASTGDITINLTDTVINLQGENSDGIYAANIGYGLNSVSDLSINIETNGGSITTNPAATPGFPGYNYGIVTIQKEVAKGHINIRNNGTKITTGRGLLYGSRYSDAIYARMDEYRAEGNISITNDGALSTQGDVSHGIHTVNNGSGTSSVINSGEIHTAGIGSTGIFSDSHGRDIRIENNANITSEGKGSGSASWMYRADGIIANSVLVATDDGTGTGRVLVKDQNNSTIKASRYGIRAIGGSATIESNSNIIMQYDNGGVGVAEDMLGLDAHAAGSTGDAIVNYDGTTGNGISLTTKANGMDGGPIGIRATNDMSRNAATPATGRSMVTASGDISVHLVDNGKSNFIYGIESITFGKGDASLYYKKGVIDVGVDDTSSLKNNIGEPGFGYGLVAWSVGTNGHGNAILQTDSGTVIKTTGDYIRGVHIQSNGSGTGVAGNGTVASADQSSEITTNGLNSHAVSMRGQDDARIVLENKGKLTTKGDSSDGVRAESEKGGISISNKADIKIQGNNGKGIFANSQNGGAIFIDNNTGSIVVGGAGNTNSAIGITARANNGGDATVISAGDISALGNASSLGIEAKTGSGLAAVEFGHGEITGSGAGIAVSSNGQSTGKSSVLLDKNGIISADGFGVISQSFGGNTLVTDEASIIRSGAGVQIGAQDSGAINQFEHSGLIETLSDLAISENSGAGVQTFINNYGTIYGNIDTTASSGNIHFSNYSPNSWNIRNYFDSDGDGGKDTKAVAVSNFGAGYSELTNAATGTVRLAVVNDNINTDTTGEYTPRFTATPSIRQNGIVQGQLLNLDVLRNAGTIDLSANNKAGDVLLVSGGTTPGVNGGGVYISDGGVLKLNTTLNSGGPFSESDILAVDNVKLGSGATQVDISPSIWSTGGKTVGNGIKVVEVQGTSDPLAFVLKHPVTSGAFDYYLAQGIGDQSWYLRNDYTAAVGGYLSNQYAAATMFNMNIHDRRDNVRDTDSTLWVRLNHNDLSTRMLDNSQKSDIQTTLIQMGADVLKKGSIVAGVYAGYGNSSSSIKTHSSFSNASGKVDGYHIGAYASWLPEENKGPYVDLWGYYGWYKNKLDSNRHLIGKDKYDSKGWSLSAEAGYGFAVKEFSDGKTWIIQPHAQLIYTHLKTDDFVSKVGTESLGTAQGYSRFHGSKSSGVLTRLGARTYWTIPAGNKGLSPFVEVNWLHNGIDNKVKVLYDSVDSKIGKNAIEVRLGAQGQVTNRMSVWGQIGGQHGSSDYSRYDIQFGLGWRWK